MPLPQALVEVRAWLASVDPDLATFLATTPRPWPDAILLVLDLRDDAHRLGPGLGFSPANHGAAFRWAQPSQADQIFAGCEEDLGADQIEQLVRILRSPPPADHCWMLVVHGPAAGVVPRPLYIPSKTANHRPACMDLPGGKTVVNAAAMLRVMYGAAQEESTNPEMRAAAARFRERVNAELARASVLQKPVSLDDILARVGNLPRLERLMATRKLTTTTLAELLQGDAVS